MSEADAVAVAGPLPATVATLATDLRALGLAPGLTVLMHSSLRALGWVVGGAEAVVEAVLSVLGPEGTLVVPSFSTYRTDPHRWHHPPVPESWWPVIRAEMPAYDPRTSSTRHMGAIADCVLRWPGVRRSGHPHISFAAIGPRRDDIVGTHPLAFSTGDTSPLARLYDLDGYVLLLGVGHGNNTSLHLAEYRASWPGRRTYTEGAAVLVDGRREWVTFEDLLTSDEDFPEVGAAFEAAHPEAVRVGQVGAGTARLLRQRPLVDFGAAEITRRRS
jgi:aminoglycoside 3-N-acetyltransferase